MTQDDGYVSILLDIKEDLGILTGKMTVVEQELRDARQQRIELKDGQAATRAAIVPIVSDVSELKTDVAGLKIFEGKISQYIWAGGIFVSGLLFFLWKGLEFFASDIKAWLGKLFH